MADDPVVPPTDPAPALTPAAADSASIPSTNAAAAPIDTAAGGASDPVNDQAVIDELLKQANFDEPAGAAGAGASAEATEIALPDASTFDLPAFQQVMSDAQVSSIDLLRDVELNVKIELGRSRMLVEDVL